MKQVFALCAVAFALMYIAALATLTGPKNDGIVRLKWGTDPNPARTEQIKLFNKLYPNIEVSVSPTESTDGMEKFLVQCATGIGPDFIDTGTVDMETFVNAGMLLDLTPYAKKLGIDPSATYPALKDALEVDGKQYRFPCNISVDCIIYNKKVFDDRGVPYPKKGWTYDDFVKTCLMLKNNKSKSGKKQLVVIANWLNLWLYQDLLMDHGGRFFSPSGLKSELDSPESVAALTDYYNLMHVYKVMPTPAEGSAMSSQGGWGSGGLNWFSHGDAAMIDIGRWYIVQVPNYPDLVGNLGSVEFPRTGAKSAVFVDARAAGINVKGEHIGESLKFLQYLASPQYSKIIVDDGDSLPPNPALGSGPLLVNSMASDPSFHQPFVDAMKTARALDYSPYIDATETQRWITEVVEQVENKQQTPSEALHRMAAQINQTIQLNLARRPDLAARAHRVAGG